MITVNYDSMPDKLFKNYLEFLISQVFKILPIKEQEPETLGNYLESMMVELKGNQSLIKKLRYDANFMRLLGTIQYLIDTENCEHKVIKREVFKAISIVEKLQEKYLVKEGD